MMTDRRAKRTVALALVIIAAPLGAQAPASSPKAPVAVPAAIAAIKEADLKRDLYVMAGPGMRGREAGTIDELRASAWLADQFRTIGVTPKGDDGTYFQWWNMRRTRISTVSSSVTLDGRALALWTEITPTSNSAATRPRRPCSWATAATRRWT